MADSKRERIFKKIKTTIEAVMGIGQVSRGKISVLSLNRFPAAFIMTDGADVVNQTVGELITREMTLAVIIVDMAQAEIHQQIETSLPKVQKALAADYTLGGLSLDLTETAVSENMPLNDEETIAAVAIRYECLYRVLRSDPYS